MTFTAGVLGASGYAGAELLRLLAGHPSMEVAWAAGDSSAGQHVSLRYPALNAAYGDLAFCSVSEGLGKGADVVFMALPHGESAPLAAAALAAAGVVVDLSADFRLQDPADYPRWYGADHALPGELGTWAYGLPELHRAELEGASKIAVPGCYPTAALLALAPLLEARLIEPEGIVVDAKSGLSGAGRSADDPYLFSQANEDVVAYGIGTHRHTPEIEQGASRLAGRPVTVTFVPHLVPMTRGILATCHGRLAAGVTPDDVAACHSKAYAGEPFVDVLSEGWPHTRSVATTNRVQVRATAVERSGQVVSTAAIDNLVKGAAGQAVQCANLALGLAETAGLDLVAPSP